MRGFSVKPDAVRYNYRLLLSSNVMCSLRIEKMVKSFSYLLIILSFILGHSTNAELFDDGYRVVIKGFHTDKPNVFCKEWRISEDQVKLFFKKAERITPEELHQEYDWLPCYSSGEIYDKSGKYEWEIRLIGIGILTMPNGKTIQLGCKTCDEIF